MMAVARERYSVFLDEDVRAALKAEAGRTGRRMSDIVNERLRASFQDAQAALEGIRRTRNENGPLDLNRVAELTHRYGPEVGLQAVLLASGAFTNTEYADYRQREAKRGSR